MDTAIARAVAAKMASATLLNSRFAFFGLGSPVGVSVSVVLFSAASAMVLPNGRFPSRVRGILET